MKGCRRVTIARLLSLIVLTAPLMSFPALARDAAFLDPGSSGGNVNADEAVRVDPKGDVDTGESILNIPRRTTLFFANQTNQPVHVESVVANGDGNVTAEIANDDCSKQGTIAPLSRCSVEVSVTPTSPGPWSVQVLLTHNGAGRIARAKMIGKTSGATAGDKKDTGLALSTKEISPVTFGDVDVDGGKAVRSALMVNDSPDPITLYSIDVIEAGNGLERLDQGCAVDMELKPGESCPVTLVWTPTASGQISTDLIIRHSGRLGFAVIPIRGNAKGGSGTTTSVRSDSKSDSKPGTSEKSKDSSIPPPPSEEELDKATSGKVPPVSVNSLTASLPASSSGTLRLIGTVGNRAVILKPDGTTAVTLLNEDFDLDGKSAKITSIDAKSVEMIIDGKKKTLTLEAAPELTSKASTHNKTDSSNSSTNGSNSGTSTSAPATTSLLPASISGGTK